MEGCPNCGEDTSYICTTYMIFLWKKPKGEVDSMILGEDISEELGIKLDSEYLSHVIRDLQLKIQTTDTFSRKIINNTQVLLVKIENMCKYAIKIVNMKKKNYVRLLKMSQEVLVTKEREEIDREMQTSVWKRFPTLESKDIDVFYKFNFLQEYKNISKINLLDTDNAKYQLEKEHNIFLEAHSHAVTSLVITAENKYLISGDETGEIRVWNLQSMRQEGVLRGHNATVRTLAVSRENKYIFSGSSDRTIRIWSFQEKLLKLIIYDYYNGVSSLIITNDNTHIFSCSPDEHMKMWHLQDDWSVVTFKCYEYSVRALAISSDDKYLISGGNDENIRVWSLNDNSEVAVLRTRSDATAVAITSDNKYIISGERFGYITLWNFQTKKAEDVMYHLKIEF